MSPRNYELPVKFRNYLDILNYIAELEKVITLAILFIPYIIIEAKV